MLSQCGTLKENGKLFEIARVVTTKLSDYLVSVEITANLACRCLQRLFYKMYNFKAKLRSG